MSVICNLSLEDIDRGGVCENKMSGVKTIFYALKDDIFAYPTLPDTRNSFEDFAILDGSITMKSGKRFFKFQSEKDLGELKYEPQGAAGGKSLRATLEIFHAGFKAKILGFLAATLNEEVVILAKLNNGEVHLLGDKDRGAEIGDGTTSTSGKALSDPNGVTLFLTYDTPTPQIYTEDLDALLTTDDVTNYTIAASVSPSGSGTITGAGTYASGEHVTLRATAAENYTFNNWTENGSPVSTDASYTFTVSGNRTLVANFVSMT